MIGYPLMTLRLWRSLLRKMRACIANALNGSSYIRNRQRHFFDLYPFSQGATTSGTSFKHRLFFCMHYIRWNKFKDLKKKECIFEKYENFMTETIVPSRISFYFSTHKIPLKKIQPCIKVQNLTIFHILKLGYWQRLVFGKTSNENGKFVVFCGDCTTFSMLIVGGILFYIRKWCVYLVVYMIHCVYPNIYIGVPTYPCIDVYVYDAMRTQRFRNRFNAYIFHVP